MKKFSSTANRNAGVMMRKNSITSRCVRNQQEGRKVAPSSNWAAVTARRGRANAGEPNQLVPSCVLDLRSDCDC